MAESATRGDGLTGKVMNPRLRFIDVLAQPSGIDLQISVINFNSRFLHEDIKRFIL